ncbi:MAG: protein kinase [Myxococcales bacterium]|nr:protein kinase [Myxococcales bacterium]
MPETVGQYQLLAPIASGGMAEVWLARRLGEAGFARDVVLKRMHKKFARDEQFVRMFLDEARLTATLQHPNIAQILDLGREDEHWYIAMEFVDGPDLGRAANAAIVRGDDMPVALASWIVARAADGLHHAHQQRDPMTGLPLQLIHRDVSHANVLLSRHGDVKIIDFGIARANVRQSRTRIGVVKGKPGYLAPEQLQGLDQDGRVDVFSLGVVLWELLTGQVLFRRKAHTVSMERTLDYQPPPPSTLRAGVSRQLDEVVLAALEKTAADRIESADALSRALEQTLRGEATGIASRTGLGDWIEASPAWPPKALRALFAKRAGKLPEGRSDRGDRSTRSPVPAPAEPPPVPNAVTTATGTTATGTTATSTAARGTTGMGTPTTGTKRHSSGRAVRRTVARVSPGLQAHTEPALKPNLAKPTAPRRDNLMANQSRFFGRHVLLHELRCALLAGDRLVTVTGRPGVGKSRLAGVFARHQAPKFSQSGGTWSCRLTACTRVEDVCRAVSTVLGLSLANASSTQAAIAQTGAALAGRGPTLLWLDDAPEMPGVVAPAVKQWLAASATLVVVVTARDALELKGEHVLEVPPLSTTGGDQSDASQLLRYRAGTDVQAEPGVLGAIAAKLEGVPLALELAAAELATVGAEALLAELENDAPPPLEVLSEELTELPPPLPEGSIEAQPAAAPAPEAPRPVASPEPAASASSQAPAEQPPVLPTRTRRRASRARRDRGFVALSTAMRAIGLPTWQHEALVQLSVLRGGISADSATAVLQLTESTQPAQKLLNDLRVRSLLVPLPGADDERYVLHDSVRVWLAGEGDLPEGPTLRSAARYNRDQWGVRLAERCASAARGHDGARARALLAAELDNLLPIHTQALDRKNTADVERALRLSSALLPLLLDRGPLVMLSRLLDGAIEAADELAGRHQDDEQPTAKQVAVGHRLMIPIATALAARAETRVRAGAADDGLMDAERALTYAREADDLRLQALAQLRLGNCHRRLDHSTRAMRAAVQARILGQQVADLALETEAMHLFGCVYYDLSDRGPARRCFETSLRGAQQLGDRHLAARAQANLGCIQADLGELDKAESTFAHALADERAIGNLRGMAVDTCYLALVAQERGDHERAADLYQRALDRLEEVGDAFRKAYVQGFAAWNLLESNELDAALDSLELTVAFFVDKGDRKLRAMHMAALGYCHRCHGDAAQATDALDRATQLASDSTDPVTQMVVMILRAASDFRAATQLDAERAGVVRARARLAVAQAEKERPADGPHSKPRPALAAISSEVRFALRLAEAAAKL